ncbi:unnamed protein product [Hymenolepis diminuta]|uniref:Uncharacterized protein n=1 Tax=Hymenolepis diminuta TaxID=6216 RepID=A0A3P7BXC2_HYMDI|nr:unnamed protein product [Hymenolepis diminuta]
MSAKILKPAADEMEAVAKLGSRAKLANLVPIPSAGELALGSGEVANHVQPLCFMMEDLKYINPNLLAVMTEGVNALEGHSVISKYLVDTVGGQIIHSVVHRKAVEPTSLVVSENWVLVS